MHYTVGRILDFKKGNMQVMVQGIHKNHSLRGVRNSFGFDNGYGGFHLYGSNPYLTMHICLYRNDGSYFHADVDVRAEVLKRTGKTRVTENLMEQLRMSNVGRKCRFYWDQPKQSWEFVNSKDLVVN